MKNNTLKGIYAITPSGLKEKVLIKKVTLLLKKGVHLLQYRDKKSSSEEKLKISKRLKQISEDFESILIINDDPLLAKEVGAEGVHLGQKDISYEKARTLLGPKAIIGISCQNNLELALKAQAQGANYVAFGSIYQTKSKNNVVYSSIEELRSLVRGVKIPCAAIGGINITNLNEVWTSGVDMFAISSGLFEDEKTIDKIITLSRSFSS